jgi:hypothetical protein
MKSTRRGLGKGKGVGYKNMIRSDPVVHRNAGLGRKTYSTPTERKMKNQIPSKITKEEYLQIGKEAGLDSLNQEQYAEFMQKRFPEESFKGYAKEWADRFKSGHPTSSMDSISKAVYDGIVKKPKPVEPRDESYSGWTNWDTWNTMLILDNDERTSNWLNEWAKNFKKKKEKGKFDYEKAEKVVRKYLVPVARGNKSWVTDRQLYAGQIKFTGDKDIDPKKVNAREVVDAILEREV